jgi:phosphotriesterase-related protein
LDLLEAGFSDRIVLSSDLLATRDEIQLNPDTFGESGYGYLMRNFLPRLRNASVDEETIAKFLKENPSRILTGPEKL